MVAAYGSIAFAAAAWQGAEGMLYQVSARTWSSFSSPQMYAKRVVGTTDGDDCGGSRNWTLAGKKEECIQTTYIARGGQVAMQIHSSYRRHKALLAPDTVGQHYEHCQHRVPLAQDTVGGGHRTPLTTGPHRPLLTWAQNTIMIHTWGYCQRHRYYKYMTP